MQIRREQIDKPASFRNTWLTCLAVRLPTIALAVDDSLVAFTERAAALILIKQQPPDGYKSAAPQVQHQSYPRNSIEEDSCAASGTLRSLACFDHIAVIF